jgi:CRISPR/Cas system-associated exonuclease Cas4 (RecB family)
MAESKPREPQTRIIRASELSQYAYCARAWWLGVVMGVQSTNTRELQHGLNLHRAHGQQVWWSRVLIWVAVGLVALAAIVLIATLR